MAGQGPAASREAFFCPFILTNVKKKNVGKYLARMRVRVVVFPKEVKETE